MLKRLICVTALTCAGTIAAPAWAGPIHFDLVQAMRDEAYTLTGAKSGATFPSGGETAAETASLTNGGISVTFSAGNLDPNKKIVTNPPYVYLDKDPDDTDLDYGGSGLGVCQTWTTGCAGEDEISIDNTELLFANFNQVVTLTDLLFSPENNTPLITEGDAESLVAVSADGGGSWGGYLQNTGYTGTSFVFAVQSTALGFFEDAAGLGGENGGKEFYLREFKAKAVPEPGSIALFGTGLLVFFLRRLQRPNAA